MCFRSFLISTSGLSNAHSSGFSFIDRYFQDSNTIQYDEDNLATHDAAMTEFKKSPPPDAPSYHYKHDLRRISTRQSDLKQTDLRVARGCRHGRG